MKEQFKRQELKKLKGFKSLMSKVKHFFENKEKEVTEEVVTEEVVTGFKSLMSKVKQQ